MCYFLSDVFVYYNKPIYPHMLCFAFLQNNVVFSAWLILYHTSHILTIQLLLKANHVQTCPELTCVTLHTSPLYLGQ